MDNSTDVNLVYRNVKEIFTFSLEDTSIAEIFLNILELCRQLSAYSKHAKPMKKEIILAALKLLVEDTVQDSLKQKYIDLIDFVISPFIDTSILLDNNEFVINTSKLCCLSIKRKKKEEKIKYKIDRIKRDGAKKNHMSS
jgi:hypothetical protein